jgi:hypothetical protein
MDYTLGDVLHEVNELRFYQFSLPPLAKLPKGHCKKSQTCVIAVCFPCCATDGSILYYLGSEEVEIDLPELIREFIMDFDNGCWPSLIEKSEAKSESKNLVSV